VPARAAVRRLLYRFAEPRVSVAIPHGRNSNGDRYRVTSPHNASTHNTSTDRESESLYRGIGQPCLPLRALRGSPRGRA